MNRRSAMILAVAMIVIQVGLAMSPLFPTLERLLQRVFGSQPAGVTVFIVGIQIALLSGVLALQLLGSQQTLETLAQQLSSDPSRAAVSQVRDDAFYEDFLRAIKNASHTVLISYFNPQSPITGAPRDRVKYYETIAALIRSRPNVRFRRLMVNSSANLSWLKSHVVQLGNAVNVEIALINDAIPERGMPLPLSVQIVDDRHVWLVAIADHERTAKGYRDLYLEGTRVADGFRDYYDRLWGRAQVAFEKGALTAFGESEIKGAG